VDEVLAAARARRPAAAAAEEAAATTAEELREEVLGVHAAHATHATALEALLAGLVVDRTLLRVREHLVPAVRAVADFSEPQPDTYAWVSSLKRSGSPPLSG
jgi:hypothetical protein